VVAVKIFVSGATGVIGRRAIPHLIATGHEITAMARSPAKADALERPCERIDETVALEPVQYNRTLVDAERSAQRFTEHGSTGIV
jgi:uncharacterized protein YbjT (DUF2867 family)